MKEMNERTCIVTRRRSEEADGLIRFVAGPDGSLVPDLKRKLPGRGCWVTADRATVEKAVRKGLFSRALKAGVRVPDELAQRIDQLLAAAALGALGLARKAGLVAMGSAKVEGAVRSGEALLVLHATDGSPDGIRKIDQARRATVHLDGPDIPACKLFSSAELGLALGGANVIHAAVLAGDAGRAAFRRVVALDRYRGGIPVDRPTDRMGIAAASQGQAAEDME